MKIKSSALIASVLSVSALFCATQAQAQQKSPWAFYVGAAHLDFKESSSSKLVVMGTETAQPLAGIGMKDNTTVGFGVSYDFNEFLTARLALGIPPTTTFSGQGSLEKYGTLGKATYGVTALTLTYNFTGLGSFTPYIGGGIAYAPIFKTKDGDKFRNLKIKDSTGPVIEVGLNYAIDKNLSIEVNVAKAELKTTSTGELKHAQLGWLPATSEVKMNPVVSQIRAAYRF